MSHVKKTLAVGILLVALSACSDRSGTMAPPASLGAMTPAVGVQQLSPEAAAQRTLDASFVRISERLPGFGGVYLAPSGELVVRMTSSGTETSVRQQLLSEFGEDYLLRTAPIAIEASQYDFKQLSSWFNSLASELANPDVTFWDIAEDRNRIVVGVTGVSPEAFKEALRPGLSRLGIPDEAVLVEERPAAQVTAEYVTDKLRPIFGGIEIARPQDGEHCTLGFIVETSGGEAGLVTNSHCTLQEGGGGDLGVTYQDDKVANDRVGIEIIDPHPFSCPESSFGCRYTDAALIVLDAGINSHLTKIAQTMTFGYLTGSKELRPNNRVFTLQNRMNAFVGQYLDKIGRTTGWTRGAVTGTCVNIPITRSWTRLCQTVVNAGAGAGDSGSPVFGNLNFTNSTANLYGILWGGVTGQATPYYYSPISALELELGCFTAVVNEEPCFGG